MNWGEEIGINEGNTRNSEEDSEKEIVWGEWDKEDGHVCEYVRVCV